MTIIPVIPDRSTIASQTIPRLKALALPAALGGAGLTAALVTSAWMFGSGRTGGPYNAWSVSALTLAFLVLALRPSNRGLANRLGIAFAHLTMVVLLMFTVNVGLERWEENGPRVAAASQLAAFCLNVLGYIASAERGQLLVNHPDGLIIVSPSPEKLAAGMFALFWISWVLLRGVRGETLRLGGLISGLGVTIIVGLVRFVALLLYYLEHDHPLVGESGQAALDTLGSHWLIAPALLFAGVVLDRLYLRVEPEKQAGSPKRIRDVLFAGFVMIALGTATGLGWSIVPPGAEKSGRILVDDRFCGIWEPTARRLDTDWYGDFPTYSFTSLAEWLGKWFSIDVNTDRKYDDDLLSRYDILILKTPEESIPAQEVSAIDRFVRQGGGLLLVGDHTNLLGMGTYLNAISAKYGIRFRYDSVSDGPTGGFVDVLGPPIGRHVGSLHVDHLQFMTSCSLQISSSAESVLSAEGCRREPHDYAGSSFFGRRGPHPEMEHGRTVLAATTKVGLGRVAAFTDSTVWSSFAVFSYDREKLAMDMIRMLNRESSPLESPLRVAAGIAALLGLTLGIAFARSGLAGTAIVMGLSGAWSGDAIAEGLHRWAYAWPAPNVAIDEVSFLWKGGACAFPPVLGTPGSLTPDHCFDTLLVSVQRLGLVPRVAYDYEKEMIRSETRAIFAVAPVEVPPLEILKRLESYVRGGGHLVIVDDGRIGERGSAKELLGVFGVSIQYHGASEEGGDDSSRPHVHVGGGMVGLKVPASDAFVARKPYGRGQVIYMSEAIDFSRTGLGHCFSRPWKAARDRYETIFTLLRDVLGIAPKERRLYGILR